MRDSEVSIPETAARLGIWTATVRNIVRRFEPDEVLQRRSLSLLERIRQADDLERKWDVYIILDALRPVEMTKNALLNHFEWNHVSEISLRELMDLIIPLSTHPKPGYLLAPMLDFRFVGVDGFWSMVSRFAESNLGERGNQEWRVRLAKLRDATRIVGLRRTWSKPCIVPPSIQPQV